MTEQEDDTWMNGDEPSAEEKIAAAERLTMIAKIKGLRAKAALTSDADGAKDLRDYADGLMASHKITEDDLRSDDDGETWDTLRAKYVYIKKHRQFVARELDATGEVERLDVAAFKDAYHHVAWRYKLGQIGKSERCSITEHAFRQPPGSPEAMTTYTTFGYMPNKPEDNGGAFNMWRPSALVCPEEKPEGSTVWFHDHLSFLFADDAAVKRVLDWMAGVYQFQEVHPHHGLLIHGRETGTGKTVVRQVLGRLLGEHNTTELDQKLLADNFEYWKVRTKLLSVEEVRPGWMKNDNIVRDTHNLIGNDRMPVNIKHASDLQMTNVMAVIAGSNKDNALHIENTERRWLIESTDRIGGVRFPKSNEYYQAIYGHHGVGGFLNDPAAMAALAWELKHRDLGAYDIAGPAPATEAKEAMAANSAVAIERWMVQEADNIPLSRTVVTVEEILDNMPGDLVRGSRDPRADIATALRKKPFMGEKYPTRILLTNGKKITAWVLHQRIKTAHTTSRLRDIYENERRTAAQAKAYYEQQRADFYRAHPPVDDPDEPHEAAPWQH